MPKYQAETLSLIDAIPEPDNICFNCPVQALRNHLQDGIPGDIEDVALWPSTAGALLEERTALPFNAAGGEKENRTPSLKEHHMARCLLRRVQGLCPTYTVEGEDD